MNKLMSRTVKQENGMSLLSFLKCLLFSYILTTILLLLLAFLLYKLQWKERIISIAIIVIYCAATFFAGFMAGKMAHNRKFLWGLLIGGAYFLVLVVISLAVNKTMGLQGNSFLTTLILCTGGGMLGGMVS